MSTYFDVWAVLFDAIWGTSAQDRMRNGGPTHVSANIPGGIASGVSTLAGLALDALHPGTKIPEDVSKILVPVDISFEFPGLQENISEKAKYESQKFKKIEMGAFQQLYHQILSNKISEYTRRHPGPVPVSVRSRLQREALKEAESQAGELASVKLGERTPPSLKMGANDFVGFFFNPRETIDKLTEKAFGNRPGRVWQILMAGDSAVGAGLMIRRMLNSPYFDAPGDAIMIAAVDPHKRPYIFAGALKPGHVISDERKVEMIFDNALDMVGRAGNFSATRAGGTIRATVSPEKRVMARYGADAIIEYVKQQRRSGVNISVDDVINNWGAHSAGVQNIMQSDRFVRTVVKQSDRGIYQRALRTPNPFEAVENAWIRPTLISPVSRHGGAIIGPVLARPPVDTVSRSLTYPRELLKEYLEFKLNRRKWLGRKFAGVHNYHNKLTEIIDKTVEYYAESARRNGDYIKADAYDAALLGSRLQARKLTTAEKLYWYKLKWDAYKDKLGPTAGFGLITGDFFTVAAGAPIVENDLIPKVNIFSGDMFEHIHEHFSTAMPAELTNMLNGARNLRGNNLPPFLMGHSRLSGFAQTLMAAAGYDDETILKNFGVYKPIPLISKNANIMQRGAYIVGTIWPYQLVKSFLDGSLGDRFIYIGMRFGNVTDFDHLTEYEKWFLKWGLRLNNSVLYNRFRRLAMGVKFIINSPIIVVQVGFKMYKKVIKRLARKVMRLARRGLLRLARSRIMRARIMRTVRRALEALLAIGTGGLSELFIKLYDAINFITGGFLDKILFKTFLYAMYAMFGIYIILTSGVITAGGGFTKMLGHFISVLPIPGLHKSVNGTGGGNPDGFYEGFGLGNLNTDKLHQYVSNSAEAANYPEVLGATGFSGYNTGSFSGEMLDHSACPVQGCITQMWGPGATEMHQRTEAIDIGANGGTPVYALFSGTAVCLHGDTNPSIMCPDHTFPGDAVMIKGNGMVLFNLHVHCLQYEGSWHVEAGDPIGWVADERDGVQWGECWKGAHLHLNLYPPNGATLYCSLKAKCEGIRICGVRGIVSDGDIKCETN